MIDFKVGDKVHAKDDVNLSYFEELAYPAVGEVVGVSSLGLLKVKWPGTGHEGLSFSSAELRPAEVDDDGDGATEEEPSTSSERESRITYNSAPGQYVQLVVDPCDWHYADGAILATVPKDGYRVWIPLNRIYSIETYNKGVQP